MSSSDEILMEGKVLDVLAGENFRVLLENGVETKAKISGKLRHHKIHIILGDQVTVKFSPYDLTLGIIVQRKKWEKK